MSRRLLAGVVVLAFAFAFPVAPLSAKEKQEAGKLTKKQERKRLKKLEKELQGPFKRWLKEDVLYIITGVEKKAFVRFTTGEEREDFIEQFWMRRDPTPDSMENEYKEEHYRRIAYANDRFASGFPGWRTDRGRIYITFGPPDEIEDHPSGGLYDRPMDEGGGTTSTYPFQIWRYRYIEGIGTDILIEFVDPSMTGEYRHTMDPYEKDALTHVPGAGATLYEQMGMMDRSHRVNGNRPGVPHGMQSRRYQPFERLEQWAKLQKPPPVKFKDLEAVVESRIEYNTLPYDVKVHYVRITDNSILTGITVQLENKDLIFREEDGLHKGIVNIFGRVTTLTRRIATVFEDTVSLDTTAERLPQQMNRSSVYHKSVPLAPGMYRLELVVKDVIGETMSTHRVALHVPKFEEDKLASSSLILADKIERVPTRSLGTGQFVIGSSKVRPRIGEEFKRSEKMGIYVQIYNLGEDEETRRANGSVTYKIARLDKPEELLLDFTEDINTIRGASPRQTVVEKLLPLGSLNPGEYRLSLEVSDSVKNEVLMPSATFKIQ
jgi:GWxTD domain-containing protein